MCVNKFMQTREHFTLSDQIFFHIIIIHDYVAIRLSEYILVQLLHGSSSSKSTLKVGVYISTFFLIFWQFQKVGGVTKSQPIDPFFDVIYLFLNVRFGQKVLKFIYVLP